MSQKAPPDRGTAEISWTWTHRKQCETWQTQTRRSSSAVRFDEYACDPNSHYDEMFSAQGQIRPLYRA
ncbi:MAG TPA: hypothetical protein VHU80_18815, partial [Polyangiaceae bacterium]|nr:hypothetical protein [Polyangiaceae bacterium]